HLLIIIRDIVEVAAQLERAGGCGAAGVWAGNPSAGSGLRPTLPNPAISGGGIRELAYIQRGGDRVNFDVIHVKNDVAAETAVTHPENQRIKRGTGRPESEFQMLPLGEVVGNRGPADARLPGTIAIDRHDLDVAEWAV